MKITVSGWPGAGSTTLALILAKNLKLKYLSGGELFRFISTELEYDNTGKDRILADQYLEQYLGPVVDKYFDEILTNKKFDNILIESDIANFRIGKRDDVVSIFILADEEIRRARLSGDKRSKDINFLKTRDLENQKFYGQLYNINWLDIEEIRAKHSLVIDNSDLGVTEELDEIYDFFNKNNFIDQNTYSNLINSSSEEENTFFSKGKSYYIENLKESELFYNSKMIIQDLNKFYKSEIENFPENLKNIFLGIN
jgi:cytidylate kinase